MISGDDPPTGVIYKSLCFEFKSFSYLLRKVEPRGLARLVKKTIAVVLVDNYYGYEYMLTPHGQI